MKLCWNLTALCNENCVYCFRELLERPLDLEDNLTILKKLKAIGTTSITFAGGEPLLYPGVDILMRECRNLGIKANLITNGSLLNKDNLDMYLSNITKLTFSIDSPNSFINETIGRGAHHYEHIKKLLPYIKEKYPNIILEVNTVVTYENSDEMDFMFEALGSEISFYGLKKWKISRFCPLRGYAKERKNLLSVPDQVFECIKDNYSNKRAFFEIQVRDLDAVEENVIISPSGNMKKAFNQEEYTIVSNLYTKDTEEIKKLIRKDGGIYV